MSTNFYANKAKTLEFPNAVVQNAVTCRNTQMSAKERKCPQKSAKASPQKSAKGHRSPQRSAKERLCVNFANNQLWEHPKKQKCVTFVLNISKKRYTSGKRDRKLPAFPEIRLPETQQKRATRLTNEIGMNFCNEFRRPLTYYILASNPTIQAPPPPKP